MNFLHLSDLHFEQSNAFQMELYSQLIKDLETQKNSGFSPRFVLFSGDLVNNPDETDVYTLFESEIIQPIISLFNLDASRIILCPGNHDVKRSHITNASLVHTSLLQSAGDQNKLCSLTKKDELKRYAFNASKEFFELCKRLAERMDLSILSLILLQ